MSAKEQTRAYYVAFCIVKDFTNQSIDDLTAEHVLDYENEFENGWRVAPNEDGYINPQGKFIRTI